MGISSKIAAQVTKHIENTIENTFHRNWHHTTKAEEMTVQIDQYFNNWLHRALMNSLGVRDRGFGELEFGQNDNGRNTDLKVRIQQELEDKATREYWPQVLEALDAHKPSAATLTKLKKAVAEEFDKKLSYKLRDAVERGVNTYIATKLQTKIDQEIEKHLKKMFPDFEEVKEKAAEIEKERAEEESTQEV